MLLQLSHFFLPFIPLHPVLPPPTIIPPPQFTSMGPTYKSFGFSIYYTILNLPLSNLCLPFMLLIPCTFSPILPLPLPANNCMISISVVLLLFSCLLSLPLFLFFQVQFLIVVSLLSFYCSQFLIFFFLDKSL